MSITIYSTPTCPFCIQLKKYLDEHEVTYTNIDVSSSQEKAQEMIQKSRQMGVPVTDIDGQIVIGFDKEKLNELLQLK
ncbi:MAG: Glutaredoxin-like protein, YruB-family [Candidatus Uhrbacteria bacterium GW2011_GWF2_39_13]|uniref:Glutaredoxin-like protein, YruB-family n=1 Tax=Candidatus Uhrbacteria bacterium GW2011_GWF2_39_13 TaxID=1618995 RepID=A0A0G0Q2K0_9BACT|nr:MAG: Glutaredoxin-like protein, YruB-family [Candidatus Uhrbacteria bacterium GW2011_GWF2_39_13]HAU66435.1 NrdH-redoxin [Candidatus Uhrbacteria bacterium]